MTVTAPKKFLTTAEREAFNLKQTQERWANLRTLWKQTGTADAIDPTTLLQVLPLTEQRIVDCVQVLRECQRTWQIERQILIYLYDSEVHKHPSIGRESFGLFLSHTFDSTTWRRYQKEVAIARREQLLDLPVGTYSIDQFRRMVRFRCYVPIGGVQDKAGGKIQGIRPGVKRDELQISRLKECWQIACNLSGSDRPKTHHLESAVQEMSERYPGEYSKLKPRSSLEIWKNRAIVAENRVAELEAMLAQFTGEINRK
jgi:hypothetical protein